MKISIVTATYNAAHTLRDTIESVLAQDYGDIEYIVVDGASTDGTISLLQSYESRFAGRMRWVSEPDKGIYDAMNKGLRMATGDVVGTINSDDFYNHDDVISRVAACFADTSVQAVYGDVRFVRPDDLNRTIRYYSSSGFTPRKFRYGWMPAHPTFFTYRRFFDEYGYYRTDYRIAADYELLIRFLYTYQLHTRYLAYDFIKMRTGGGNKTPGGSKRGLQRGEGRGRPGKGIFYQMPRVMMKNFFKIIE